MCKLVCMHITVIFIQIYKRNLNGKPTANTICPASVTQIHWENTHTDSCHAWNDRSGISSRLKPLSKHIFTHTETTSGSQMKLSWQMLYVLIWFLIGVMCVTSPLHVWSGWRCRLLWGWGGWWGPCIHDESFSPRHDTRSQESATPSETERQDPLLLCDRWWFCFWYSRLIS